MSSGEHILLIVRTDVVPEMDEEFNCWYNEEHIPRLLKVPGVLWAKRGTSTRIKFVATFAILKEKFTNSYKDFWGAIR